MAGSLVDERPRHQRPLTQPNPKNTTIARSTANSGDTRIPCPRNSGLVVGLISIVSPELPETLGGSSGYAQVNSKISYCSTIVSASHP